MVEIVFKNSDYVVINKPAGIPSQSDLSGDQDAMLLTSAELRKLSERDELWLVHRLDRVVGGLLVFARNKRTAADLSKAVSDDGMEKEYLAVVEGFADGGIMEDYIYKDSRAAKGFTVNKARAGAKYARLEYDPLASIETEKGIRTLVRVKLHTGRFHQIRVQFSSRGLPLVGDGKYGSHDNRAKMPSLYAVGLTFELKNKKATFKTLPDMSVYPWSLFDLEAYK